MNPIGTADSLAAALKSVYTEEAMDRQFRFPYQYAGHDQFGQRVHIPMATTQIVLTPEQKARQQEMVKRYAAIKRGGRPSYRQRQKNARKAREG